MKEKRESQRSGSMIEDLQTWEDDGGAAAPPHGVSAASLTGTLAQVERAERMGGWENTELDRVAASFRSVAGKSG
jgi:hypothetical protein